MLVELILATCTECGRPTFSSCRVWQWLVITFSFLYYEINQSIVYQQIELCCYSVCQLIISRLARFNLSIVFQVLQHCGLKYSETSAKCCFIALFYLGLFAAWIIAKLTRCTAGE